MPKFRVAVEMTFEVEMTDEIAALGEDKDWAEAMYGYMTPEEIAEHMAWNLGVRERDLDRLDGFADQPRDAASAILTTVDYITRREA